MKKIEIKRESRGFGTLIFAIPAIFFGIFALFIFLSAKAVDSFLLFLVMGVLPTYVFISLVIYIPYRIINIRKCRATIKHGQEIKCEFVESVRGRTFVGTAHGLFSYRAVVKFQGETYKTRLIFTEAEVEFMKQKTVLDAKIRGKHIVIMGSLEEKSDFEARRQSWRVEYAEQRKEALSELNEKLLNSETFKKPDLLKEYKDKVSYSDYAALRDELEVEYFEAVRHAVEQKQNIYEKYLVVFEHEEKSLDLFCDFFEIEDEIFDSYEIKNLSKSGRQIAEGLSASLAKATSFSEKMQLFSYFCCKLSDNDFDRFLTALIENARFEKLSSAEQKVLEGLVLYEKFLENIPYARERQKTENLSEEIRFLLEKYYRLESISDCRQDEIFE